MKTSTHISIIVPAFNEAPTLKPLYYQICDLMGIIGSPYEMIFVDDGSTDGSFDILQEIYHFHQDGVSAEADTRCPSNKEFANIQSPAVSQVIVIQFRCNMGKAMALAAGFARARGDVVITIDADLQDDPSEIPNFLAKIEAGYDVVSGWKINRQDSWSKVLLSRLFNRVVCWFTRLNLHDINCGFKAYRRQVIQELLVYGDRHRYLPILAYQNGFRVTEVPVKHLPRQYGKSKYGIERIPRGFLDLLTILFLNRYLKRPLHFFGVLGLLCFISGIGINFYLAVLWFVQGGIGFRPLLMLGILLMILGLQFFSIGFLGEMFTNAFERINRRYPIKRVLEGQK
ncbi:MAG: glycosyltransferase family 2 protein [Candidatus Poribacteria bacterium]|nr:glycosyltransferase family 2 protein [Candidatus Poribacteria bacterium]